MLSESYFLPKDINGFVAWPYKLYSSTVICWSLSFGNEWSCNWSLSSHSASRQACATGWPDGADDASSQTAAANRWNGKLSVTACLWIGTHPCTIPGILLSCSLLLSHGRIVPEGEHVVVLAHGTPILDIQHTCDFYHCELLGDYGFQSQKHKWDYPIKLPYGICSF